MTAFSDFQRLETEGVWRAGDDAQRRDVIISVGEATLTISDIQERPLSHWSLPALERVNAGERPALFRPGPDSDESLEIEDEEFIAALNRLQRALNRRRPHPGRLRSTVYSIAALFLAGVVIFWLPKAMIAYTARVVPESQQMAFGTRVLEKLGRVGGTVCNENNAGTVLERLHDRLLPDQDGRIVVVRAGVASTASLPGGYILLNRSVVEDHADPAATAGYVIAEDQRRNLRDPMGHFLNVSGLNAAFGLLTSGDVSDETLDNYVEYMLTAQPMDIDQTELAAAFVQADVPTSPYAYAIDIAGETTAPLINADGAAPQTKVLRDNDWVRLQGICGE